MAVPDWVPVAGFACGFRVVEDGLETAPPVSFDGTYQLILDVVCAQWRDDELDEGMARLLSVDSTVVRAHQHAAGAPSAGDTGG